MANESSSEVKGIGTIRIQTSDGRVVLVKDVRYVPTFSRNLMSLGTFESQGCTFGSEKGVMKVSKGCRVVLKGSRHGSIYFLQGRTYTGEINSVTQHDETDLWHSRLGHIGQKGLDCLVKKGFLKKEKVTNLQFCENCVFGKAHKVSFSAGKHTSQQCLQYVHADLWGSPTVPASLGKCHYFLSLIDDMSRKVWVYFLKTKDEAFQKFTEWRTVVENQSGLHVKTLRTDNGLEFCNKEFDQSCVKNGIFRHRTTAYTPQHNGVAERINRTILEKVRSMLSESGLPKVFWAEAVNTAVYLINKSPASAVEFQIPDEIWSKNAPSYSHLRIFGCICYYHQDEGKLQPRARNGVFIGYPSGVKGYKI